MLAILPTFSQPSRAKANVGPMMNVYWELGRVYEVIPQSRNGKQIERRVKVATTSTDESTGEVKVVYVLRDLSCIAPVDCPLDS